MRIAQLNQRHQSQVNEESIENNSATKNISTFTSPINKVANKKSVLSKQIPDYFFKDEKELKRFQSISKNNNH